MLKAILNILGVTMAVVGVALAFGALARRLVHQDAQIPPHPWFERPEWRVAAPVTTQVCAGGSLEFDPQKIYLLPVHKTPRHWEIKCALGPAVDEYLIRSKHHDWILEVEAGAGEDLDNLVDIVSKVPGLRIGVHARSQRAARALRKKAPNWVFAADDASLVRLHLFSNLFLETVVEFWPDFVIANGTEGSVDHLSALEIKELRRRNKRVLWAFGSADSIPPTEVDGRVESTSPAEW